ncbi:MAG: PCMD domain-containing protein [Muribaculaceae bacterium]|nr:PCMD domain-containing protein [Muribaculaceae bacterium]
MKKNNLLIAGVIMAAVTAGCAHEYPLMTTGSGTLSLSTKVQSEVQVVSRALTADQEQQLAENAIIWISNSTGLVHQFIGTESVPESLRLLSGNYTAEAWVGDSVPASWDKTFYKSGFKAFDIAAGKNTELTLTCRVANTLASVRYSDEVLGVLSDPVMTVALEDGITDGSHSLIFDQSTLGKKGRFMINSRTEGLRWTLTGTQSSDGAEVTKTGLIKDIKAATEYRLNVTFSGHDLTVGGAFFDIEVEEEPIGDDSGVAVVLPPNFFALEAGFDDDNMCRGESGNIGRKSVFISACSQVTDLDIEADILKDFIGVTGVDILNMDESFGDKVREAGITWQYGIDEETKELDFKCLRVNFEEEFTNKLPEGSHVITITAVDKDNRKSTVSYTIKVTDAPAIITPIQQSDVSYTAAHLEAEKLKEASEFGFEIREVSASRSYEDWTRVAATVDGNRIYADVTDLKDGTEYEYRVYADDYVAEEIANFSTKAHLQLENAGFELWSTDDSDNAILPSSSVSSLYWDSGNHGSIKAKINLTDKDTQYKHGGKYSAKMESTKATVLGIGKFAAGNIFIGKYLKTDGTDGVLGWGRPFNDRPKAVKVWVRYEPKTVDQVKDDNADGVKAGDMDKGIIYIALTDNVNREAYKYDNQYWPMVVKTKSSSRQLFSKDQDGVIGYGEIIFTEAVGGDNTGYGMAEITIPINYRSDDPVANIIFVASASKMGDYFTGGQGSTMWLDDIELIYE